MIYNIFFEVAAFCFMLITFVFHMFQYKTATEYNKKFRKLLAIGIASDFFDFYTALTIYYYRTIPLPVNTALNALNFVLMAATGYAYCSYVATVLGLGEKTKGMLVNKIIFAAFILSSAANMFFGFFFYFDPDKGYCYGEFYIIQLIVSYYYVLYALWKLIANRKKIEKRVTYSAGVYAVVILICAVIQVVFVPDVLLYGFGVGLSTVIVFFSLETPDYYKLKITMEELERSNEAAVKANRAKSTFLAQMSHEIRTPINAVLGMNEMILRESKEENVREYAENAYNAGNALLSIINDILDISKIEAGKMEIVEADYDLSSLVSDCYLMTADRAKKKGLELTVNCDENLPSKLKGDMFHIRQVAVNFLINAVKYTDEGSITLSFSGEKRDGEFFLSISVKDTGVGLTEESKENLFESFQRFELERNQFVEGTGLGLSICRQITELMNGRIEVKSVYGQGSEFICTIPQQLVNETPIGKIDPKHSAGKLSTEKEKILTAPEARVLVVDDIEMNLIVFSSLLKSSKIRIDTALSGKKCLELVKEHCYDIIFMDHMMPDMSGIETFEKMKETEHKNKNTPVIMLTANAISGEKEKYLSKGFSSYLTKPIQSDKLEEVLTEYLPNEKINYEKTGQINESAKAVHSERFDVLKEIDCGFDLNTALGYCSGSEVFYAELLRDFADTNKLSELDEAFSKKDFESYERIIHTLKGMVRTLGFASFGDIAEGLQKAAAEQDVKYIEENHNKAAQMLSRIIGCAKKI